MAGYYVYLAVTWEWIRPHVSLTALWCTQTWTMEMWMVKNSMDIANVVKKLALTNTYVQHIYIYTSVYPNICTE